MQSTLFERNDDLWNFSLMYRKWPNTGEQNKGSFAPEMFYNIVAKLVNRTSILFQILIWPKEWKGKDCKCNTCLGFAKSYLRSVWKRKITVTNRSVLCFLQQQRLLFCVKRFVEEIKFTLVTYKTSLENWSSFSETSYQQLVKIIHPRIYPLQ